MDDLIERLRAVKWEEADDCGRMPDDPTHKCVFVDMRPAEFQALLREAADALEEARAEIEVLRAEVERLHEQLRLATVDQAIAEAEANDAHAENKRMQEALVAQQPATADEARSVSSILDGANVAHATATLQAEVDALRTRLEDTVRDSTNEIEALRADVERLRADLMESDEIREKLGHLLTRTAAALKGEPPECVWHSWHDLPERAERLTEALRELVEVFSDSGMYDEEIFANARAALAIGPTPGPFVAKIGTERPAGGVDRRGQVGKMSIPAEEPPPTMSTTYRACYWTDDRGAEVRLTGPEHAHLPDDELEASARAEAEHVGLDLSYGRLVIGDWTD